MVSISLLIHGYTSSRYINCWGRLGKRRARFDHGKQVGTSGWNLVTMVSAAYDGCTQKLHMDNKHAPKPSHGYPVNCARTRPSHNTPILNLIHLTKFRRRREETGNQ